MTVIDLPTRQARRPRQPLTEAQVLALLERPAPPEQAAAEALPAPSGGSPLARRMKASKLYVFTLPKAGTYFLAELASRLGWYHSGIHLGEDHYLDTAAQSLAENAHNPSAVRRQQPFTRTLAELPAGALCVGHMPPLYFNRPHQAEVAVLACRRHPREALVSEFIDFRFRRDDELVRWIHPRTVPDHLAAFTLYLRQHGPVMADIVATWVAYHQLRQSSWYVRTRPIGEYAAVDFETLMGADPLPALRTIARAFGQRLDDANLLDLHARAKAADNKTKAVGQRFPIPREALWTPQAEAAYQDLGMPELARLLGYPG
ncbi:hypothetical protein [Ideonella livida]|uniref:Sulfotransferase domain-containing protein n=1 Tax=Ideonella livida TaxID=2707176 RepID=A0A7C9PEQ1_9BURK|nr:hypothetical protein [Ideonella livida]NDY89915.1 hypothetical protein [Ideonella livida]